MALTSLHSFKNHNIHNIYIYWFISVEYTYIYIYFIVLSKQITTLSTNWSSVAYSFHATLTDCSVVSPMNIPYPLGVVRGWCCRRKSIHPYILICHIVWQCHSLCIHYWWNLMWHFHLIKPNHNTHQLYWFVLYIFLKWFKIHWLCFPDTAGWFCGGFACQLLVILYDVVFMILVFLCHLCLINWSRDCFAKKNVRCVCVICFLDCMVIMFTY